ncbi:EPT1 Ethanolaminephosphotransferase, partial [Polypterus senegalus]
MELSLQYEGAPDTSRESWTMEFSPTALLDTTGANRGRCREARRVVFALRPGNSVDGKHARRTHSSSPLGELFDHGLDSWATSLFTLSFFSVFGLSAEREVTPFTLYYILCIILFTFMLSHWEKYNTGVLFLPWGYDISQVCRLIVCQMTKTRSEVIHWLLIPLAGTVGAVYMGLEVHSEFALLTGYTLLVTVAHVHYGICVEMLLEYASENGRLDVQLAKEQPLTQECCPLASKERPSLLFHTLCATVDIVEALA